MVAGFRSELDMRRLAAGRRRLLAPLVFYSAALDREITVPAGFEYDGASVPWWIPVAYVAVREAAEKAGAVHDWLYGNPGDLTRAQADEVFREALEADGVGWFVRNAAWLGVRAGGWMHFKGAAPAPDEDRERGPIDESLGG